ncbi:mechanosensitive ion channel family protein [Micromonospora citrea]|uniref:mechanosensitive ion channel family protein n=1 Tax=Micromonospora citrea TaxID=47855 RepID=UPI003C3575F2
MKDNFGDAVGDAFRAVMLFLPKALAFVAILVVGWLVAKAVLKIVDKVLERVHFDKAVERGGIKTALARSRYDASDIVAKLAYYGVLLVTLQLAFGIWGPNPISDLIAGVIAWLPRAFVAIVIVVVAAAIATAVKDIISSALGGLSYGRVLANIASVFILGLGVIAALNQIGVATAVTTPVLIAVLATVGGILVVGVGGGLVRPMQNRWESWLTRAEQESQVIATHARAYQAGKRDVQAHLGAYPATRGDDADATQVVPRADDADATQVVPRHDESDRTQPVTPYADADVNRPANPVVPPQATARHDEPARDDVEATMVIPPADAEKFRR